MVELSEEVRQAWEQRDGVVVFTTVDKAGIPNTIYASSVLLHSSDTILIANNHFSKTLENIQSGSKGSVLFITSEKKSYQVKGSIEYHTQGPIYEGMKQWNPKQDLCQGVVALKAEEAYSGAEKLC